MLMGFVFLRWEYACKPCEECFTTCDVENKGEDNCDPGAWNMGVV